MKPLVGVHETSRVVHITLHKKRTGFSFPSFSQQTDDRIGEVHVALGDWEPNKIHKAAFTLLSSVGQEHIPTKIGKKMRREGYSPKLPIVIVPGLASSSLKAVKGRQDWIEERVWLSLSKIGTQSYSNLQASIREGISSAQNFFLSLSGEKEGKETVEKKEDTEFRASWVSHMCLQDDGVSDPEGIQLRPVEGKPGCMYLDPGMITRNLSYVMGPLITNLHELGYSDTNLVAVPYDWRLPPHYLEERDQYFSKLKETIEQTVAVNQGSPVVLMGHSMGNRIIQYFLNLMKFGYFFKFKGQSMLEIQQAEIDPEGLEWIKQHIHTFMAVGAPFLGAPKIVRGVMTGERMGLDALLSQEDGIKFTRALGSMGLVLPMGPQYYFPDSADRRFVYFKEEGEGPAQALNVEEALAAAGAHRQVENLQKYYKSNVFWGDAALDAPPVQRLYAIYGINLDTEFSYFYKKQKGKVLFDEMPDCSVISKEGYTIKNGIVHETKECMQPNTMRRTGLNTPCCGDGTVPYVSLSHVVHWKDSIPELLIEELEGAEHREILNNRIFFKLLIEYVAEKSNSSEKEGGKDVALFLPDLEDWFSSAS